MNLTTELLADLRKKAEELRDNPEPFGAAFHGPAIRFHVAASPAVVLALLDRIADLETALYGERMGEDL